MADDDFFLRSELRRVCSEADEIGRDCDAFLARHQQCKSEGDRVVRRTLHGEPHEQRRSPPPQTNDWNAWFQNSFQLHYEARIRETTSAIFQQIDKEIFADHPDSLFNKTDAHFQLLADRIAAAEKEIVTLRTELAQARCESVHKIDVALALPPRPRIRRDGARH